MGSEVMLPAGSFFFIYCPGFCSLARRLGLGMHVGY